MRFASLALERYGRFADCELTFRAGAPDLHVIYGANEAGKSTSLAAVSDLLFGFPARAQYAFLFDTTLLRVGAVLEEDGRTFACRRKRGRTGTLIDEHERPLDEGALLAMLHGQTRETFALSFSLDQQRLREGGSAMVEARNDVGRALFAAGSGLTGVSDQLAALEGEADAIWGPRASARRSFTQAQRELAESQRIARERTLKPRTWLDARSAVDTAQATLDGAEARRDAVQAQMQRAERLRRIAPAVRAREDLLQALLALDGAPEIDPGRSTAAEIAIADADRAARDQAAAEQLVEETRARLQSLVVDDAVIERGEEIDGLVVSAGAVQKALLDLDRLTADLAAGELVVARLREDAGGVATPPARAIGGRLRDMAAAQAQDVSALGQIAESEASLTARRDALAGKQDLAGAGERRLLEEALADARALGADADERFAALLRRADAAAATLANSLARLAPWRGSPDDLLALPTVAPDEVAAARALLAEAISDELRHCQEADRARSEADAIALQEQQLAAGTAVSPDEIEAVRGRRAILWSPLRNHVLSGADLDSPSAAVDAFEHALSQADERSDQRFAAADGSSRLALLAQSRTSSLLAASQADARASASAARAAAFRKAWSERLEATGHPDLDPDRLAAWLADRDAALAASAVAVEDATNAETVRRRRDAARTDLLSALGQGSDLPSGDQVAPLLQRAERQLQERLRVEEDSRLRAAALAQLEQDSAELMRRRSMLEARVSRRQAEWLDETGRAGLVLEMTGSAAALDAFDDLRRALQAQEDVRSRIAGIKRDAAAHDASVRALCDVLTLPAAASSSERLFIARRRLADARSAKSVRLSLEETLAARLADAAAARARRAAALSSVEPLNSEVGAVGTAELLAAIERSGRVRAIRNAIRTAEGEIVAGGDGYPLEQLLELSRGSDPDELAARAAGLVGELDSLNADVRLAADAHGDAKRAFAAIEEVGEPAVGATTDAEQARAELSALAEHYILKRSQVVTLRWAIERYREENQDPLLLRASQIFSSLTLGRYAGLTVDADGAEPRLIGLRDDGRSAIEVPAMSEGTTDQLFLALRLAATEQSVASGARLPFLADDLFVNFDDDRSEAGFRVLAELANHTQVLFFTHHPHLAAIARSVVGAETHSECSLA